MVFSIDQFASSFRDFDHLPPKLIIHFISPHLIVDVDSTTTTSLLTTHSPSGARVVLPTSHSILPRPSISNLVNRPSFFSEKVQNRHLNPSLRPSLRTTIRLFLTQNDQYQYQNQHVFALRPQFAFKNVPPNFFFATKLLFCQR